VGDAAGALDLGALIDRLGIEIANLNHYRYVHAFDHLYGAFRRSWGVLVDFV
jgi:hypothetical protein